MKTLRIQCRGIGAIGVSGLVTVEWPDNPTKADVMALYEKYEHIQSPTLLIINDDGRISHTIPYPEFYAVGASC